MLFKGVQVVIKELLLDLQLNYINGGVVVNQVVWVLLLLWLCLVNIMGYDGFFFDVLCNDDDSNVDDQKIVVDKFVVMFDKNGVGCVVIGKLFVL